MRFVDYFLFSISPWRELVESDMNPSMGEELGGF